MTEKLHGLSALLTDAVKNASRLIERVQKETADRHFGILELIPSVAPAARVIHTLHDLSVSATHETIRFVTTIAGKTADAAIDAANKKER